MAPQLTMEHRRLQETRDNNVPWRKWGPYLSERQWGTVREDYSADGNAWDYFTHDQARSRAYRWGEDGLAGISGEKQLTCFALAFWNGRDPILKERLFGLTNSEANHGEDVKEYYFYLDSTPTHSYMKYLYKYPQSAFPYGDLIETNKRRNRNDMEYELLDTGVFNEDRYFDVFVEYAKQSPTDMLAQISVCNRGPEAATLHVLPTLWFRNTWSWGEECPKPELRKFSGGVELEEPDYGRRWLYCEGKAEGSPGLLFTENESNAPRLWGCAGASAYAKDGIGECVIRGNRGAVNPEERGTKAAAQYVLAVEAGECAIIQLLLTDTQTADPFGPDFSRLLSARADEANDFYATVTPRELSIDARNVMRQAFAGLLGAQQDYRYVVRDWLRGDPGYPPPPAERLTGRNHEWTHLYNADVISMPDKWEYPWYAAWDLAFHCLPLALVDSQFAKEQLVLMTREWYMHPNGQLPAYEWAYGDVNPPVHAWAAWRVYKIEQKRCGKPDRAFLERVFHKLLLNFTWWVNRKDAQGNNVFQGGFLGLDNIGVFDRSAPLPTGGFVEQADGTGWMAMHCLNLLAIALELAREDSAYEDVASKFWEHFLNIAHAMHHIGHDGDTAGMWDEEDGFFYDILHMPDGSHVPMKVRSAVGLIPLFAMETLEPRLMDRFPGFKRRMEWFIENRRDLTHNVASMAIPGRGERRLLSIEIGR